VRVYRQEPEIGVNPDLPSFLVEQTSCQTSHFHLLASTTVHSSNPLLSPLNSWIASSPTFEALDLGTHHPVVFAGGFRQ
jgi:hypothetical protein